MTAYARPSTLTEALTALGEFGPEACILAGGTDLMLALRAGIPKPAALLNIFRIDELRRITLCDGRLELGATVTVADLLRSEDVRRHAPLLYQAADRFASPLVRARATLGGNLCNASPAADLSLALLALDAQVELASAAGRRTLPLEQFVLGVRKTARQPGELVIGVGLPLSERRISCFEKSGSRPALEISAAALAFSATLRAGKVLEPRIACGAVAPTPMRARQAEKLIAGQRLCADLIDRCAHVAAQEIKPIDDFRASARHRRRLIAAYVRRSLEALHAAGN